MKRLFIFMHKDEGWKSVCAVIYLVICIFDFIVVPTYFGASRAEFEHGVLLSTSAFLELDPTVQIKMIDSFTFQHDPFTLKGAGMFHLAFGALLTGSALNRKKDTIDTA